MSDDPGTAAAPVTLDKGPAVPAERPRTVVLCAAALVASGLLAVIASLTLFGLHSFLVHSTTKSQPKPVLTIAQVSEQVQPMAGLVTTKVAAGTALTKAQIDATAKDVQDYLTTHLPKRNMKASQIKDQAADAHDAVTSTLGSVKGVPTSTQVSAAASKIQQTVDDNLTKFRKDQKKPLTAHQIQKQANRTPVSQLIASIVLLVALSFVALNVWRGRHWARWGVLIVWVLCSFTGTLAGLNSILSIFGSVPNAFKIPSGLSGILAVAAVVLAMMPASVAHFALSKPVPVEGAPARRGLFAPRPPAGPAGARGAGARGTGARGAGSRGTGARGAGAWGAGARGARGAGGRAAASTRAATTATEPTPRSETASADRQRSKKRTSAESARIGADLARSRAKAAAKSRRSES